MLICLGDDVEQAVKPNYDCHYLHMTPIVVGSSLVADSYQPTILWVGNSTLKDAVSSDSTRLYRSVPRPQLCLLVCRPPAPILSTQLLERTWFPLRCNACPCTVTGALLLASQTLLSRCGATLTFLRYSQYLSRCVDCHCLPLLGFLPAPGNRARALASQLKDAQGCYQRTEIAIDPFSNLMINTWGETES
jgi:hypothetical protein